jgi:hypothetical protein
MKRTVIQKQFCIEVAPEEMLKILRRDDTISGDSLHQRLFNLGDIHSINYDGHFGPYIWFMINVVYDFPHNHKLIENVIQNYIDGI